jgi:hypothetical protein
MPGLRTADRGLWGAPGSEHRSVNPYYTPLQWVASEPRTRYTAPEASG